MAQTILLTGITGFIGKHVALKFLNAGYAVRGTLRKLDRAEEVRAALRPHLADPAALDRLEFALCELLSDAGWDAAMQGVQAVVHTASPFPTVSPKDDAVLIRPAVEGTLRVLHAARRAGVGRIVLTSSYVAVGHRTDGSVHDESDWLDPSAPGTTGYGKSKVLAERAAWEFVAGTDMALTVINPGLVLGPPLDGEYGDSIGVVKRLLKGKDPMLARLYFTAVDVRDVAEMHLRAVQRPQTAGKRYLAVAGTLSFADMARVLKAGHPERRIPTRVAPNVVVRLLALFDPQIRAILPSLDRMERASATRAEAEMDMRFIPAEASVTAAGDWLVANAAV